MVKFKNSSIRFKFIFILITILEYLKCIIPGFNYKSYELWEQLNIKVGKLDSIRTQFPFSYFYLPVCKKGNTTSQESQSLGEILTGEVTFITDYEANLFKNEYCKVLCKKKFNDYDMDIVKWMIEHEYVSNWFLDDLPAGRNLTMYGETTDSVMHDSGIPIGSKQIVNGEEKFKIYNHLTFNVFVNKDENSKRNSIVEFSIVPFSIQHEVVEKIEKDIDVSSINTNCAKNQETYLSNYNENLFFYPKNKDFVVYTYDVIFYDSPIKWASRWDHYMKSQKEDIIHWFSMINSILIIFIFTSVIALIFCRVLKKDIDNFNSRAISDDMIDDSGWKQVSNDVFRKPRYSMLLCVLVGTGIQLFLMGITSLSLCAFGFISPKDRGTLVNLTIFLFVFLSSFAGYYSTRFFKMFNQVNWLINSVITAFLYPALSFTIFFIIDLFLWAEGSVAAVPFSTMIALLLLWLCCSTPLVLIGAFIAIKKRPIKNPGKVNVLPSQIPTQPWYLELKFICLIGGIIPFGAIFIELIYIMGSLWRHYFYYLFGFLLLVLIIMIITSSEISIIIIYVQLCKGDYRWWWKSFFISGSVGLYIAGYAIYYYFSQLRLTRFSSIILYFGYMSLFSISLFLISSAIGFIITFLFLRKIYSMIKID